MLDITGLLDAAITHASSSGHFETVNGLEPLNTPMSGGLDCAVWVDRVTPVRSSGLNSVSVLVVLNVRLFSSSKSEPRDAIDPELVAAVDTLCAAYCGDFTLGGLVRQVDILGQHGVPLGVRAGYVQQSGDVSRVLTVELPLIVNDLWEETP